MFFCIHQRDHQRKVNPSGRTAGSRTNLGHHIGQAIPYPDRDLVINLATLYILRLATSVHQEVMEVQVPTKTLNSPFSIRLLFFLLLFFIREESRHSHGKQDVIVRLINKFNAPSVLVVKRFALSRSKT